jgi:hypothetical protein
MDAQKRTRDEDATDAYSQTPSPHSEVLKAYEELLKDPQWRSLFTQAMTYETPSVGYLFTSPTTTDVSSAQTENIGPS